MVDATPPEISPWEKPAVADWWTNIQDVNIEQQKQMLSEIMPKQRRKKHYRRKPSVNNPSANNNNRAE